MKNGKRYKKDCPSSLPNRREECSNNDHDRPLVPRNRADGGTHYASSGIAGEENYLFLRPLITKDRSTQESTKGNIAPRTPSEKLMAKIWSDILNLTEIGAQDNFFD